MGSPGQQAHRHGLDQLVFGCCSHGAGAGYGAIGQVNDAAEVGTKGRDEQVVGFGSRRLTAAIIDLGIKAVQGTYNALYEPVAVATSVEDNGDQAALAPCIAAVDEPEQMLRLSIVKWHGSLDLLSSKAALALSARAKPDNLQVKSTLKGEAGTPSHGRRSRLRSTRAEK